MHALHVTLGFIRNVFSYISARRAGFWITTVLIALVVPSPIAAAWLYARFRRGRHGHDDPPARTQRMAA